MNPSIQQKLAALKELCAKHKVKRLELFGSAAKGSFDPDSSDLDFVVEFLPLRTGERADTYFGLKEDLEALFGRSVDLIMDSAVGNPYFREELERTRIPLYAA